MRRVAVVGQVVRAMGTRSEMLGDVVVGAQLEAEYPVELLGASREHDDRGGGALAQEAAHVAPVHVW